MVEQYQIERFANKVKGFTLPVVAATINGNALRIADIAEFGPGRVDRVPVVVKLCLALCMHMFVAVSAIAISNFLIYFYSMIYNLPVSDYSDIGFKYNLLLTSSELI